MSGIKIPYTPQTRSDALGKDHTTRMMVAVVEAASSRSSRLVGLVVLVVNVYVPPNVTTFGKGTSAKIWMVRMVANETNRGQTRTPSDL